MARSQPLVRRDDVPDYLPALSPSEIPLGLFSTSLLCMYAITNSEKLLGKDLWVIDYGKFKANRSKRSIFGVSSLPLFDYGKYQKMHYFRNLLRVSDSENMAGSRLNI
jgi:hypothetical protein